MIIFSFVLSILNLFLLWLMFNSRIAYPTGMTENYTIKYELSNISFSISVLSTLIAFITIVFAILAVYGYTSIKEHIASRVKEQVEFAYATTKKEITKEAVVTQENKENLTEL